MSKKVFLAALLFTGVTLHAQQPVQKITIVKGQVIMAIDTTNVSIEQEAMGQKIEMGGSTFSKTALEVKETSDARSVITSTLKNIKVSFSAMGQDMNYDSEKPEDKGSEMAKAFEDRLNKAEDITIDNTGNTIFSANPKPGKKDESENAGSMDMIKNLTGGTGGNTAENAFLLLPASGKKGSSWSDSTLSEGIKTNRTYIIKSIENNIAVITILGVLSGTKKMEMQGNEMNMNVGGKLESEITVDVSTGLVIKRMSTLEPDNSIEIMGMMIPVTGKVSTVTYYTIQK
jgi:hypothetical protein